MGFLIFIPFLVIDLVVSSTLMAMGMMMLPPATIELTIVPTISCQPSTSTKSIILNGSEIIAGGSIIIPIAISVVKQTTNDDMKFFLDLKGQSMSDVTGGATDNIYLRENRPHYEYRKGKSDNPVSTILGGVDCVCIAVLRKLKQIMILANEVIITSSDGQQVSAIRLRQTPRAVRSRRIRR